MSGRHLLVPATVALLVGFGPPERTAPARWAVVVGISDYTHFGDEIGGDLPGAANDARAMADVLVNKWGFAPDRVKLVLDGDATRDRIERELTEWLPSVARSGDLVWFYFAGHGSQAWDLNGDEPDGLDETVCPADVTRGSTDRDILDDEIGAWLGALPTDNVVVVWDKCHARSSTRAVTPFSRPRSLGRDVRRDIARPTEAAAAPAGSAEDPGPAMLEIAAAQADEVAIDAAFADGTGTTYGGAFTTPFVRNLWAAPEEATYEQLFEETRRAMARQRFRQQPAIGDEPLKDRPLFWIEGADALAPGATGTIRILQVVGDDRVILAGGTRADVTTGSVYATDDALLEVVDVGRDRAVARVVAGGGRGAAGAGAGESPNDRARLVAYRYPGAALRVSVTELEPAERATLRDALDDVPSLALVTEPTAFAHLLIRPRSGHRVVLGLDGFPRDSVPASAGAEALAELLRREFGQYQLTELENPARPFVLDFAFRGGGSRFELGDPIAFRVTSEQDGFLTIVDLAPDGTVSVIFPNEYATENRVEAGETTEFPSPQMDLEFQAIEPAGRGVVRAFVTERPMALSFAQGAEAEEAEGVWQALRRAAGPGPIDGSDAIPVTSWGTAAIVYEIGR
ncbi:MAG: caspase family protein [Longimicrobiales bacterium]|nr:caspase family protein [Longimicrobiales bacterium]